MASGGNEDEITEEMLDFCGNLFEFAETCKRDSKWELIFKRGEEGEIYRRPEGGIYQFVTITDSLSLSLSLFSFLQIFNFF